VIKKVMLSLALEVWHLSVPPILAKLAARIRGKSVGAVARSMRRLMSRLTSRLKARLLSRLIARLRAKSAEAPAAALVEGHVTLAVEEVPAAAVVRLMLRLIPRLM
jgi:hypothetical protein